MAKRNLEKPQREYTRRQVAAWQKRRQRQRMIYGVGLLIILAVVVLVGGGWLIADLLPMQEKVITVNGRDFNMRYYVNALGYYAEEQSPEIVQYILDSMEEGIELNEMVIKAAAGLGITVSDDEADEVLKERDRTVNQASRDIVRTELLQDKLQKEYFDGQVPQSAEQRHVLAIMLESEGQVGEARSRLDAGEEFAAIASELSLNSDTKEKNGDLGWQPAGILPGLLGSDVVEEHVFSAKEGEWSPPLYDADGGKQVGYWLIEVTDRDEEAEQADIRMMLLASMEEEQEIKGRLEAGEDFGELYDEYSQYKPVQIEGGVIEGMKKGDLGSVVDDFVFNHDVELGVFSEPLLDEEVYTKGGFWLVMAQEIDADRAIEAETREVLIADMAQEWVQSLWDNPENRIESRLDEEKKQWAYRRVTGG